jgi:hypothetical protein
MAGALTLSWPQGAGGMTPPPNLVAARVDAALPVGYERQISANGDDAATSGVNDLANGIDVWVVMVRHASSSASAIGQASCTGASSCP